MRRRDILKMFGAGLGLAAASPALASPVSTFFPEFSSSLEPSGPASSLDPLSSSPASSSRRIIIVHPYSDEYFEGEYWTNGAYNQRALSYINHLMRDRRHGGVETSIDTGLLDLLHDFNIEVGNAGRPVYLVSGYRQPYGGSSTKKRIVKKNKGAARRVRKKWASSKTSQHAFGKAIDLRLDNITLARARAVAIGMERGGVGYYGERKHLHLDTGPVRYW